MRERVWGGSPQLVQGRALALLALFLVGAGDPRRGAVGLVDLFDGTCLQFAGDKGALRRAVLGRGLRPMTGAAAAHLLARPGAVYDASGADGHRAVLSFDNGMCGAVADDVDAASLLAELAARTRARGIAVTAVGSAPSGAAQLYRLAGPGVQFDLMVAMHTEAGRTQVSMLATADHGR